MRSMRYRSGIGILLGALLLVSACQRAHAELIDGIVAVVDNSIIMDSDLQRKMDELGSSRRDRDAQRQVLELMVEDIIIQKIYGSLGFPRVGDEEANALAEKMNVSPATARTYIMKSSLMDMMVRSRVVITENMVKNSYEKNPEYRGKQSVRLNQILIKGDPELMNRALGELKAGKPFVEVAKEYSDVLASGSPDIGWIAMDDLSGEVEALARDARPGEVIGPVGVDAGQAVYQIVEKGMSGGEALSDVKDEITEALGRKYQQEAFNHWLHKMMSEYYIGIYI